MRAALDLGVPALVLHRAGGEVSAATVALVPVDNMAELDTYAPRDREVAITGMLDQAHTWLAHAVESSAPAQDIANFKAFIATAAETAKRLRVSKEIQVDAEVMVRRSERALGQAIRSGQERGEIRTQGRRDFTVNQFTDGLPVDSGKSTLSPTEFATEAELGGNGGGIYAMTDDVTDADFEAALDEAKDEGNVSRANVVRKVKSDIERPPSPPKYGGNRRKQLAVLDALINGLGGLVIVAEEIRDLDSTVTNEEATRLTSDLSTAIKSLNRINKLLLERAK